MDFKQLQKEAIKLKNKAVVAGKDALEYSTEKLVNSALTLKTQTDLTTFIEKSQNTSGIDSKTGKSKEFMHQVIVIFLDTKSKIFTQMLYQLPLLQTKAFSQNIKLRLADISMKGINIQEYNISGNAALVIFENVKNIKTINGEKNIQKVVKAWSLDINKSIEEL